MGIIRVFVNELFLKSFDIIFVENKKNLSKKSIAFIFFPIQTFLKQLTTNVFRAFVNLFCLMCLCVCFSGKEKSIDQFGYEQQIFLFFCFSILEMIWWISVLGFGLVKVVVNGDRIGLSEFGFGFGRQQQV